MNKLTEIELKSLQTLQREHTEIRLKIADLEISKLKYIHHLETITNTHKDLESKLSEKYGIGISINSATGEIIDKK